MSSGSEPTPNRTRRSPEADDPFGFYARLGVCALIAVWVVLFGGVTEGPRVFSVPIVGVLFLLTILSVRRREQPFYRWGPLHAPLLALAALPLATLPFSVEIHRSLSAMLQGWAALAIYYIGFRAFDRRRSLRRFAYGLIIGSSLVSAYGLYLKGMNLPRSWWWQPEFISATYVNHNHFAGLMELALPMALALTLFERKDIWRLVATVCLFLTGAGLILSLSRGGIVSCAVAVSLMIFALARLPKQPIRNRVFRMIPLLVIAGAAAGLIGVEPLIQRALETLDPGQRGLDPGGRWLLYKGSVASILQHPFTGLGLGNFHLAILDVRPDGLLGWPRRAHNDLLQYMVEMGIVAATAVGWLLVAWFRYAVHMIANAPSRFRLAFVLGGVGGVSSLLIHSLIDFNFHIPANAYLAALIAGIATGYGSDGFRSGFKGEFLYRRRGQQEPVEKPQPPSESIVRAFRIGGWALAAILILAGAWQSTAHLLMESAQRKQEKIGLAEAKPRMDASLAIDPWSAQRQHRVGKLMMKRLRPQFVDLLKEAMDHLRTARELSPRHPLYALDYARALELYRARTEKSKRLMPEVEEAWIAFSETDPKNAYYRLLTGRFYERTGAYQKAAQHYLAPVLDHAVAEISLREWRVGSEKFLLHPEVRRRAANLLVDAWRDQPDRTELARIRARLLTRNGSHAQAIDTMRLAWERSQRDDDWEMLIQTLLDGDRLEEAETAVRESKRPVTEKLAHRFVGGYAGRLDFAGTIRVMDRWIGPEDYDEELLFRRTWAEFWSKRYGEAQFWAHRWCSEAPGESCYYWLGRAYEAQNQQLMAATAYRKSQKAEAGPLRHEVNKALARVLHAIRNEEGRKK